MAKSDNSDTTDEPVEAAPVLNIHQRIHAVMRDVGAITPDKEHPVFKDKKKAGSFPYISHDAVTAHVKPLFVEHGIMVLPTVEDHKANGNRTELTVLTSFVNIDNPTDRETITTIGYGADSIDKGPGKALSYAVKSAYLKILMLNSQDDTGEDATEHDPSDTRTSDVEKSKDSARKSMEAAAKTYQAAINGATSKQELMELKRKNGEWLANAPDVTRDHFEQIHADRLLSIEGTGQ